MKKALITLLLTTSVMAFAENKCYIEDFNIAAGEEKEIAIVVENDIDFTAFTCDIYMPEGLEIYQEDGEYIFDWSSRARRSHGYPTSNKLESGAIRVVGYSDKSENIKDNSGDLMYFTVIASETFAGTHYIELKNIDIVSNETDGDVVTAVDNWLDDSVCTVNPILVEQIQINEKPDSGEINLYLTGLTSTTLTVTIMPEDATDKSVTWSSSNSDVVSVNSDGIVTAVSVGTAEISVTTNDGSNLSDKVIVNVGTSTSVEEIATNDIDCYVNGENIMVKNAPIGETIRVIAADGSLVVAKEVSDRTTIISAPIKGVYIVSIGSYQVKVFVK